MKHFFISILLLVSIITNAQQNYYIYLQTDNAKPFYVRYKAKMFSSSATGYLILPKLYNGLHNFKIGFLGNSKEEKPFQVSVNYKDLGFKITTNAEAISLFNLLDYSVIHPFNYENILAETNSNPTTNPKEDKAIKEGLIQKEIKDTIKQSSKVVKQTPELKQINTISDTIKESSGNLSNKNVELPYQLFQKTSFDGIDAIYVVNNGTAIDTVKIFVPILKADVGKKDNLLQIKSEQKIKNDTIVAKKDLTFLEFNGNQKNASVETKKGVDTVINNENIVAGRNQIGIINSDCKKIADNNDYLKLRKKIAGEESTEEMFNIAAKVFKQKCFTTEQVNNIAVLFLDDNTKVDFYTLAYPYVYDTSNFKNLINQLRDSNAINKFSQLIKK